MAPTVLYSRITCQVCVLLSMYTQHHLLYLQLDLQIFHPLFCIMKDLIKKHGAIKAVVIRTGPADVQQTAQQSPSLLTVQSHALQY